MEYYISFFKPLVLLKVYLKMIENEYNILKKLHYFLLGKSLHILFVTLLIHIRIINANAI